MCCAAIWRNKKYIYIYNQHNTSIERYTLHGDVFGVTTLRILLCVGTHRAREIPSWIWGDCAAEKRNKGRRKEKRREEKRREEGQNAMVPSFFSKVTLIAPTFV